MARSEFAALERRHAVLRHQHSAILQAALAVAVEVFGKKGGAGTDRIGRVYDRNVEAPVRLRDEPGAVGEHQFGARIVERAGRQRRQPGLRQFHHARIDLDLRRPDFWMAQHLAQATAVAAADDQDVQPVLRTAAPGIAEKGGFPRQDRRVGQHLVIDIFVRFGGLDGAVKGQDPAEQPVLENRQVVQSGMLPVQQPVDGQGLPDAVMQGLVEPVHCRPVHRAAQPATPRRCSDISIRPGAKASSSTATAL